MSDLDRLISLLQHGFSVNVRVSFPPPVPSILGVNFFREKGTEVMTGQVVLNVADPALALTSRPVSVTINGGAPTTYDYINPNLTFPVSPGDVVVATPTGDVNATGTGPGGAPFSATAPSAPPPPPGVPPAATVTAINFLP